MKQVLLLICCLMLWVVCIALVTADPVCTYGKLKVEQCVCRGHLLAIQFSMLLSWNLFYTVISKTLHPDVKCRLLTRSVKEITPCVACHLPLEADVLQVWLEGWWATGLHLPTFVLLCSHTCNCFWFSFSCNLAYSACCLQLCTVVPSLVVFVPTVLQPGKKKNGERHVWNVEWCKKWQRCKTPC